MFTQPPGTTWMDLRRIRSCLIPACSCTVRSMCGTHTYHSPFSSPLHFLIVKFSTLLYYLLTYKASQPQPGLLLFTWQSKRHAHENIQNFDIKKTLKIRETCKKCLGKKYLYGLKTLWVWLQLYFHPPKKTLGYILSYIISLYYIYLLRHFQHHLLNYAASISLSLNQQPPFLVRAAIIKFNPPLLRHTPAINRRHNA